MSGFLVLVFLALILIAGYYKAKKEANSTPLRRSLNRAGATWNRAHPKNRATMLASIGIFEHSPSFAVYLASTWAQLDLNICAQLAATLDARRSSGSSPEEKLLVTQSVEGPAHLPERNPALDELKQLPQTAVTAGLINALPGLAAELVAEARKQASSLGINDTVFAECILDLELAGAFERVLTFVGNRNLASLFIDAVVFEATGKRPSNPSGVDMIACLTHQHRGLAKYAIAKRYFSVPDPGAWLFGTEYASVKGNARDPIHVMNAGIPVLFIRRTGAWAAEKALTGKSPTNEETDALPNAVKGVESLHPK